MKYLFSDEGSSLFVSHGYQAAPVSTRSGGEILLSDLALNLRVLLVTDGTVTKTIEAMYCEPVVIDLIRQEYFIAKNGIELLERDVRLVGAESGKEYAFARSYLNTGLMPADLVAALKSGERGIGWLMRQMSQEQYRDVIELGYSRDLPQDQHVEGYEDAIFRTYVIRLGGQRLMQITEHFPKALYS